VLSNSYFPSLLRQACAATAVSVAVLSAHAADFYLAQSAQGSGNGSTAGDALPVAFFNIAANWSTPVKVAALIGPGDTVHLTGTITTALIFQGGGTPLTGAGTGPITLLFEPGATMTSPAWPNPNNATGAITVPIILGHGLGYIIIDGGTNGLIENTANGTSLGNSINSLGVAMVETHDSTVRNLTVANLYVRTGPNGDQNHDGIGVKIFHNGGSVAATNDLVTHCIFHDEFEGVTFIYGMGWTNMEYSFCTAYNCNWGGTAADSGNTSTLNGLKVHDNDFHDFASWDDNSGSNSNHHNGFYGWAQSGGNLRNVKYYNNTIGPNFGAYASSGIYDSGDIGGISIYNNVFLENGPADAPNDGLVYLLPNLGTTGTGYQVFNNSFLGGGHGIAINFSGGYGSTLTTFEAKNNIASGVATFIAVYYSGLSTLISDYNILYNLNLSQFATISATSTSHFSNLQQWQLIGYDTHSSTLNPNLNSDFVPQPPSSAIDAGVTLSTEFSVDFNGTSRPQGGAWDIGAAEYVPVGPVISSSLSATATQGSPFTYTITATENPTTFSASNLPPGLVVDTNNGIVSGTPSGYGIFIVTIGAGSGAAFLTINVVQVTPVITSSSSASVVSGTAFSYTITANNFPSTYSAVGLPPGLSLNTATGLISGAPTTAGNYSVTVKAINSSGSGSFTLNITVEIAVPKINGPYTVDTFRSEPFTYTISAKNSPTSFTASGYPSGFSFNSTTGTLSGTPTTTGTSSIAISATNSTGTGTSTLTLNVTAQPAPAITSASTMTGTTGAPFSYSISATNSPTSYSVTGLPNGLSLDATTGIISGTPVDSGTSVVHLNAANGGGSATKLLTLTIALQLAPVISSSVTASGSPNSLFAYTIAASNSPTSYSATGLPAGLTLNSTTGLISGTPTVAGTSVVTINASNAAGTGSAQIDVTISFPVSAPTITSTLTAHAGIGVAFTYAIKASSSPNGYSASGLPSGLSLNSNTGIISGSPTALGSFPVTIRATNAMGTTSASLVVSVSAPTARLINLSTRATSSAGSNTLITGFVVSGGAKTVLVRGLGPSLAQFGISGFLPDPQLALYNGAAKIETNSVWGGAPNLAAAFAQVGAFALNGNSVDSALLTILPAGAYTAQVGSKSNSSGIALAEIYDADTDSVNSPSRLVNLSTRANVGTGGNILIAGFVIAGSGTEKILVRGIGPTLASDFGLSGVLTNLQLNVVDSGGHTVASNTIWGGTPELTSAFALVGAFPLNNNSNDAAVILTLAAGAYTAQISGTNGTTGVALVEIYEVP
jgi:hypothetical protein